MCKFGSIFYNIWPLYTTRYAINIHARKLLNIQCAYIEAQCFSIQSVVFFQFFCFCFFLFCLLFCCVDECRDIVNVNHQIIQKNTLNLSYSLPSTKSFSCLGFFFHASAVETNCADQFEILRSITYFIHSISKLEMNSCSGENSLV